jgi:TetR/AcrR family transcriptional repressor of nem operon
MKCCATRERLLEVAMDLIWTESYGSVGVDEICRKSKIQKGSFYHFFPSKAELAAAALTEAWNKHQPNLERLFDAEIEPVRRLMEYVDFAAQRQKELKKKFGFYPGCPYTAIGIEQGGRQDLLRRTAQKHLALMRKYFERAVRDAARNGTARVDDPVKKTNEIYSLYIGAFTCLRINGDIGVMSSVKDGIAALLGVRSHQMTSAKGKKAE